VSYTHFKCFNYFPLSLAEETTGLPAGFGTRTSSVSQPRIRKMSSGTGGPSSVLSGNEEFVLNYIFSLDYSLHTFSRTVNTLFSVC